MEEQDSFDQVPPILPGDKVFRRRMRPARRLRVVPNVPGIFRFLKEIFTQTPLVPILSILVGLLFLFSAGLYFIEHEVNQSMDSFGKVLWWCIAAMQTMGSPFAPVTSAGKVIGIIWIILGTMLFFGAVIASVTAYFMLSRQRPTRQLISTIQYNLEKLEDLSIDELETLKQTTTGVIETQIDQLKEGSSKQ